MHNYKGKRFGRQVFKYEDVVAERKNHRRRKVYLVKYLVRPFVHPKIACTPVMHKQKIA